MDRVSSREAPDVLSGSRNTSFFSVPALRERPMLLRTSFDPWRHMRAAASGSAHATTSIDRRTFTRGTLAATALAALPAGRLWADTVRPAAIPSQVAAVGLTGKPITLAASDIKALRTALRGPLLLAVDPGYDEARRLWNPAFDRHPALIARCANAQDVMHAVDFGRTHQLRTAVRGGSHSLSGQSAPEGGLMIDVSPMRELKVDAKNLQAAAQGGALLGEVDRATQAAGMVTTLGTATDTGIAGLTLGGGMGRVMRRFGLAIDNLLGMDVVTADGKLRHASGQENPDLFWGLRGGGGNFGVVTNFHYRLHPLQHKVLSGSLVFPVGQARSVFVAATELAEHAPDEMLLALELVNTVSGPAPPGRYAIVAVDYTGEDPAAGFKVLEPLAKLGKPLANTVAAVSYLEAQGAVGAANAAVPDASSNTVRQWIESGFFYDTPDALFDEIIRRFAEVPADLEAGAGFGQMGGAVARIGQQATAFWNRGAKYDFLGYTRWTDPAQDETGGRIARELWAGVQPFTRGYYVNTVPGANDQRLRGTYGDNYPRLVALKEKYDPMNLFRLNANIKPATARG
jgi:FAD/FMN-containing dehydrogenase